MGDGSEPGSHASESGNGAEMFPPGTQTEKHAGALRHRSLRDIDFVCGIRMWSDLACGVIQCPLVSTQFQWCDLQGWDPSQLASTSPGIDERAGGRFNLCVNVPLAGALRPSSENKFLAHRERAYRTLPIVPSSQRRSHLVVSD